MQSGYNKDLYILAFDHRATFAQKMFSLKGVDDLSEDQKSEIREYKKIIYEGFKNALVDVPKENAAILVDEEFGNDILEDAKKNGFITIFTLEKSGTSELELMDGILDRLKDFSPDFSKILVKYNPQDDPELKVRQLEKLKKVSDFSHENNVKFLLEVLVLPKFQTSSRDDYDSILRPKLTAQMITEMQQAGVEPDVWKLEGMDKEEDYKMVVEKARQGGRDAGVVILGRGETEEKVEEWLETGARVKGVIGFAVGRTIFWDILESVKAGDTTKEQAEEEIATAFEDLYEIFASSKI